ncbi:hypothetical protein SAMN02745174_02432 [Cetobacterium ceti]|uniref:Uncharacterized protein n=1 Tax=Cetobacterium ceti TaxID=180163 RepID=A0A1T4QTT3_9FUSO|nr:hypothetical protein [Cetobacterium ceti]SKA06678.1 hypothetical protein SAMN02745174_02432 [Cetobacterium ceti]
MTKEKIIEEVEKARLQNKKIKMSEIIKMANESEVSMPGIISLLLKKGLIDFVCD